MRSETARILRQFTYEYQGRWPDGARGASGGSTMEMQEKVPIVTGVRSGIGRATARHLAQEWAKVVVADLDAAPTPPTIIVSIVLTSGLSPLAAKY
jgi:hypothetical protein